MYKKLRTLRKANDLTLKQLSSMTGISFSYLWQIEKCKRHEVKNSLKRAELERVMEQLERKAKKVLN
jgi:transcriptional regulator with XRE-family HTH domain